MPANLHAYGPLREAINPAPGDRVLSWAGTGTVRHVSSPFNGVQGIRAYATITLDTGALCAASLDRLTFAGELAVDGWLW